MSIRLTKHFARYNRIIAMSEGVINKIFANKNSKASLTLFKSFFRYSLKYSSIIWNLYTRGSIRNIEQV